MAVNFPSSPTLNQTYTDGARTWKYNGVGWQVVSSSLAAGSVTTTEIADGTILDADINASAAIAHSKLASITSGRVLLGNSSNVPTATALSGDVTVSSTGVTSIASSVSLAGNPTTTTQAVGNNSTRIATTAFVVSEIAADALPLTGGTITGELIAQVPSGNRAGTFYTTGTSSTQTVLRVRSDNNGTATIHFTVAGNGNCANTNNVYGAISDAKLKENIIDANSEWEDISRVRLRKFNLIGSEKRQLGVIAQEIEQFCPGLVVNMSDTDEDGNDLGTVTKTVNYSILYLKAVGALQEAMARIESLEKEVAELKAMQN